VTTYAKATNQKISKAERGSTCTWNAIASANTSSTTSARAPLAAASTRRSM